MKLHTNTNVQAEGMLEAFCFVSKYKLPVSFFFIFQNFAGICGALMIGAGALGAIAAGIYVDKTKRFEEVVKVCWSLAVLFGIGFTQVGSG